MNAHGIVAVSVVATAIAFPMMWLIARTPRLRRPNFRGEVIPTGFGFVITLAATPVYAILLHSGGRDDVIPYVIVVVGFGVLGLVDDLFGARDTGGFRGHIGLLRRGRVSTGLVKALGGGVIGLLAAYWASRSYLRPGPPVTIVLDWLLIVLSANALNLLDLRPGRAVSCFWVGMVGLGLAPAGRLMLEFAVMPVLAPAVVLTLLDRSARVMMGDAGSNVLGAVLGLSLAGALGLPGKLAVVACLVAVNVYSERRSISGLIESNRVLRGVDRLLGVR